MKTSADTASLLKRWASGAALQEDHRDVRPQTERGDLRVETRVPRSPELLTTRVRAPRRDAPGPSLCPASGAGGPPAPWPGLDPRADRRTAQGGAVAGHRGVAKGPWPQRCRHQQRLHMYTRCGTTTRQEPHTTPSTHR